MISNQELDIDAKVGSINSPIENLNFNNNKTNWIEEFKYKMKNFF